MNASVDAAFTSSIVIYLPLISYLNFSMKMFVDAVLSETKCLAIEVILISFDIIFIVFQNMVDMNFVQM